MALNDALQDLINRGTLIPETDKQKVREWIRDCMMVVEANYEWSKSGGFPKERLAFNSVGSVSKGILILKSLIGNTNPIQSQEKPPLQINLIQSATAIAQSHLSLQINVNIDNATYLTSEQKQEAKKLYKEVETEVQKEKPDWDKVSNLLKKSFDYGLKIAPDIIRLAETYYKANL